MSFGIQSTTGGGNLRAGATKQRLSRVSRQEQENEYKMIGVVNEDA